MESFPLDILVVVLVLSPTLQILKFQSVCKDLYNKISNDLIRKILRDKLVILSNIKPNHSIDENNLNNFNMRELIVLCSRFESMIALKLDSSEFSTINDIVLCPDGKRSPPGYFEKYLGNLTYRSQLISKDVKMFSIYTCIMHPHEEPSDRISHSLEYENVDIKFMYLDFFW